MDIALQNYRQKLYQNDRNVFLLPWASVLMQNIKRNGDLVEYKNLRKFKQKGDPIWVLCKL